MNLRAGSLDRQPNSGFVAFRGRQLLQRRLVSRLAVPNHDDLPPIPLTMVSKASAPGARTLYSTIVERPTPNASQP